MGKCKCPVQDCDNVPYAKAYGVPCTFHIISTATESDSAAAKMGVIFTKDEDDRVKSMTYKKATWHVETKRNTHSPNSKGYY